VVLLLLGDRDGAAKEVEILKILNKGMAAKLKGLMGN
jgi:hypothetical protein